MSLIEQEILEGRVLQEMSNVVGDILTIEKDTSFSELGADSLDMVGILMNLEEEFGIEIKDAEVENWKTVQNAIDYITKRMEEKR